MATYELPPSVDLSTEAKRGIIDGVKKVMEVFQAANLLDSAVSYQDTIHDPDILYGFIQAYRKNPRLADKIVVDKNGEPVTAEDGELACGVTLAQVQQLLVKTCARYYLEQDSKEEEGVITETRTTTRFLFFKKTEQVERKTGGGFDERKVREISRYMAFDWQLPLLPAFALLNSAQLLEIEDGILALNDAQNIRDLSHFDQATLKKAKGLVGDEFHDMLSHRPAAIGGISQWNKDMYGFYRTMLGDNAWNFFAREKAFFMVCASLDKPLAKTYGDVLTYIAAENLEEMQRLNIDKAGVLVAAMKYAFGERVSQVLSQPAFAKDVLRKLVESLLHLTQEKEQLAISAQLTCKAIAPQVFDWLAKQKRAAAAAAAAADNA